MKANPVVWFEIYVQDMERAKRFYESVFRYTLTRIDTPAPGLEMWGFPMATDRAGCGGALAKMDGVPSSGRGTLVYFGCEDCAIEEARVQQAGGRVERSKMSIGQYGAISLVVDTEGNMIGLHSTK